MTHAVEVRPAASRFVTRSPGIETWHSISFGPHYDPANTSYGRLLLHDEHRLDPHAGFDPHPHLDLEIVTWVVDGELVHEDEGGTTTVPAGSWQRLRTGMGVVHAERAGPDGARFVQLWRAPETPADRPSYEHGAAAAGPGLHRLTDSVQVARLEAGTRVALPNAAYLHVFVVRGAVELPRLGRLEVGDAARLTAQQSVELAAPGPAEVLVVGMRSALRPE